MPSLVYIQVRSVNGEREAIELRIQAVLAVLECRYLGKEILNYFTFLKFNWVIKGRFLLFPCAQSCGTEFEKLYDRLPHCDRSSPEMKNRRFIPRLLDKLYHFSS